MEGKTTNEIIKIDVSNDKNQVPLKRIDYGKEAESYMTELKENQKQIARKSMRDSYVKIITYLQNNLPLNNKMIQDLTCL